MIYARLMLMGGMYLYIYPGKVESITDNDDGTSTLTTDGGTVHLVLGNPEDVMSVLAQSEENSLRFVDMVGYVDSQERTDIPHPNGEEN